MRSRVERRVNDVRQGALSGVFALSDWQGLRPPTPTAAPLSESLMHPATRLNLEIYAAVVGHREVTAASLNCDRSP